MIRRRTFRASTLVAAIWDARDDHGSRLAAGVYFVRVGDAASARATIVR